MEVPPMTFDALPYDMFRRVAACLDRRDMAQLSRADVKRVVLSFCLWERTPVSRGGGLATPAGAADDGDCGGAPLGAPIYRFLSPSGASEARTGGLRSGGSSRACSAKTVLASYPRSGNSLLRRLLEEVTGTITGSDTRPDRTLSRSLSVFGMQGEGVVDDRVQVVKTHYPERLGFRPFEAERVILLVRNPFDAIDSYFNMALTNTHDRSLHDSVYEEFREFWEGMVQNELKLWERFHLFWLSLGVPVRVVRYEDLLARPEGTLTDVVAFMHGMSAAEATEAFGDRIRRAPAVVNAARGKGNSNQAARAAGAVAGRAGGFTAGGAKNGDVGGGAARSNTKTGCGATTGSGDGGKDSSFSGGPTDIGGAAATATVNGRATVAAAVAAVGSSDGDAQEAAADGGGEAAGGATTGGSAAGSGLYQPRTSGRGVGGSLRNRFTDDQVAWCVREAGTLLRRLGYNPLSQGFPPAVSCDLLELEQLQRLYGAAAGGATSGSGEGGGMYGRSSKALKGNGEVPVATPETAEETKGAVVVIVNDKAAVLRDMNDAYGRAVTPFRRSHTQRDTRPLPLRGEDRKAEEWRLERQQRRLAESRDTCSGAPVVEGGTT